MGPSRDDEATRAIYRKIAGKVAPATEGEILEAGKALVDAASDLLEQHGIEVFSSEENPYFRKFSLNAYGDHVYFGCGKKGVYAGEGMRVATPIPLQYDRPSRSFVGEELDEDGRPKSGARMLAEALVGRVLEEPADDVT